MGGGEECVWVSLLVKNCLMYPILEKCYLFGKNICVSASPVKFCIFLSSDLFQNQLFRKILSGIPLECQTVWTKIRPDVLSGLVWDQTVCKGYQQTTGVS